MEVVAHILFSAAITGSLYALLAVGPSILYRVFHIYNFSHGAIVCLGAYLFYSLFLTGANISPLNASLIFLGASFIVTVLLVQVGIRPFLRMTPSATFAATLAVGSVLEAAIAMVWGSDVKSIDPSFEGFELGNFFVSREEAITVVVAPALFGLFSYVFAATRFARQVRAVSNFREGAESLGIRPEQILLVTTWLTVVSAFLAGILASYERGLDPTLGVTFSFKAFVIMVVGGERFSRLAVVGVLLALVESTTIYLLDTLGLALAYGEVAVYLILLLILFQRGMPSYGREV